MRSSPAAVAVLLLGLAAAEEAPTSWITLSKTRCSRGSVVAEFELTSGAETAVQLVSATDMVVSEAVMTVPGRRGKVRFDCPVASHRGLYVVRAVSKTAVAAAPLHVGLRQRRYYRDSLVLHLPWAVAACVMLALLREACLTRWHVRKLELSSGGRRGRSRSRDKKPSLFARGGLRSRKNNKRPPAGADADAADNGAPTTDDEQQTSIEVTLQHEVEDEAAVIDEPPPPPPYLGTPATAIHGFVSADDHSWQISVQAGAAVHITETNRGWSQVTLADGTSGWVPRTYLVPDGE